MKGGERNEMRNDFAVFILTHGRADNVVTVPAIKKAGYTGKIYFIIDDEDDQAEEYKKNFGADQVIVFNKQEAYDREDTIRGRWKAEIQAVA